MDLPNYYEILSVKFEDPNLTTEQIRLAYKKASLLTHPDRHPNLTEPERRQATEHFQKVADAYYVLSDPVRRRDYDALLRAHLRKEGHEQQAGASFDPLKFFKSFFGSANGAADGQDGNRRPDPDQTFASVFEDMLEPEFERTSSLWKYLGTASGATLGFIVGSVPGLALGSVAGNRLGAVRDAKGKSVYAVFSELDGGQKAAILKGLALKVLGHALS